MDRSRSHHLMQDEDSVDRAVKVCQKPGLADIDRELVGLLSRYRTSIAVKYGLPGVSEKPSLGEAVSGSEESEGARRKMCEGVVAAEVSPISLASVDEEDKPQPMPPRNRECTPTSTTNPDHRLASPEGAGAAIPAPSPLPQEGSNLKIPLQMTGEASSVIPESAGNADKPQLMTPKGGVCTTTSTTNHDDLLISPEEAGDAIPPPPPLPRGKIIIKAPLHMTEELQRSGHYPGADKIESSLEDDKYNTSRDMYISARIIPMTPVTKTDREVITWGAFEQPKMNYFAIPKRRDIPRENSKTTATNAAQQLIREEGAHDGIPQEMSSRKSTMTPTTNDVQHLIREEGTCDGIPQEILLRESAMTPATNDVQQLIREEGTCDGIPQEILLRESAMTPATNDVQQLIREEGTCDGIPVEISSRETTMTPTTDDVQQLIREEGTCVGISKEILSRKSAMTPATDDVQQLIREEGTCDGIPLELSSGDTNMTPTTSDIQQLIREAGTCDGIPLELSSRDTSMTPTTSDVQHLIGEEETCDGIPPPPSLPRGGIHIKSPLHMKEELQTRKAFMNVAEDRIRVTPEDEELTSRARRTMWRSAGKPKKDEITWGQFEQPTIDYFVIPKRDKSQPITVLAKTVMPAYIAKAPLKCRDRTLKQQNTKGNSPDDTLRYLWMSLDVIKEEVRRECIAEGMRPQFIGDLYLTRLAKARKTAAETKARKPEPRAKVEKPVHLDTDLMYAVRRRVKETLPKFVGKNNSAAMMLMADGMFQEMSLDRELDDLAWPHDPLAEFKQSGLGNVDYMDPTPVNKPVKHGMQTSAVDDRSDSESFNNSTTLQEKSSSLDERESTFPVGMTSTASGDAKPLELMEPGCGDDTHIEEEDDLVRDESIISGDTEDTEETGSTDGLDMNQGEKSTSDSEVDGLDLDSDVDSALSDDDSVVSYVSYLGFDNVPASNKVMQKIHALERKSSSRSFGGRRASDDSMTLLDDASSASSDSSGYEGDSSSMCVHHKIKHFNEMKRSWQMPCKDQSRDQAVSVASSATSFFDDDSLMDSGDEDSISRPLTPPTQQQLDEEPTVPPSVTSKVRLFEQLAAEEKPVKPSGRFNITNGSSASGDAEMTISLFEGITHTQQTTTAKPEGAVKSDAADDCPLDAVDVRRRVSMFEAMKSKEPSPAVAQPITKKNGGSVLVEERMAFYEELENLIIDRREKEFPL